LQDQKTVTADEKCYGVRRQSEAATRRRRFGSLTVVWQSSAGFEAKPGWRFALPRTTHCRC